MLRQVVNAVALVNYDSFFAVAIANSALCGNNAAQSLGCGRRRFCCCTHLCRLSLLSSLFPMFNFIRVREQKQAMLRKLDKPIREPEDNVDAKPWGILDGRLPMPSE